MTNGYILITMLTSYGNKLTKYLCQHTNIDIMTFSMGEKQFQFWKLRRDGIANINIANDYGISRQAVSKALITMNKRIEKSLLEMAQSNMINVENINAERGLLFGYSVPLKVNSIIFVSAKHGVQVWYEHQGDCGKCSRYRECIELLWDFADEMGIKLKKTDDPTQLAEELFDKLRGLI